MTSQELERIANIEGRVGCYPFDARIPQRSICRPSTGLPLNQGFATTTPAVPASGSAAKNTNPFKVRLTVLTASGATATITDPSGTVGSSFPITAGQFIELDSNAQITPTYTTLTWQPYGC